MMMIMLTLMMWALKADIFARTL